MWVGTADLSMSHYLESYIVNYGWIWADNCGVSLFIVVLWCCGGLR